MIITETKHSKKIKDRNARIIEDWTSNYKPVETQITPLAESIAKKEKVSLSTVRKLVKHLIVKQTKTK